MSNVLNETLLLKDHINFNNTEGNIDNRSPAWAALFFPNGTGGIIALTGTPAPGKTFVLNNESGLAIAFEAKPVKTREGSDVLSIVATGTGSFVDFQSFTIPADLIRETGQSIVLESEGLYFDAGTLQCVFSPLLATTDIFTVSLPAPVGGQQTYQLRWKITRLNSTQANSYLTIIGGSDVDSLCCSLGSFVSTIDWTNAITIKTQGRSDINPNAIDSQQSCYFIQ